MKITIIGAGPGNPDLITVKGLKLLQEADVVLYADSLVSAELIEQAKPEAEIIKTAGMHLEEMVMVMVAEYKQAKKLYGYILVTQPFTVRSWSKLRF